MKAAVVDHRGGVPEYRDVDDPNPVEGQALLRVEAVPVENVDRAIVAGTHYTAAPFQAALPAVPCFDGVGRTADGTLVGFGGIEPPHGALAEYVVVPEGHWAPIPDGIEPSTAATLATAITGMSMKTAAGLQPGETVLVQGATGVAGRLAVQIARLLGAGRIVATGRDAAALASLADLGADAVIDTSVSDDDLVRAYRDAAGDGYDVVVDFLWGRPTRMLCEALIPETFAIGKPVRLVQVGEAAGDAFELPARAVRTSGLEIYGAARNLMAGMADAYAQVVEWVRSGELVIDVTTMPLSRIAEAWQRTDLRGSRLVIVPD
ncbi:zinc-binding alcohol dehydrogenase family protein [Microbacterium horticulturae]|uniref:Zinc-binding alcohol dehydrogenase family protein n=1 Tax=Microbacterium horticulturae TaxID=3028316 RepID=A0ABY8C1J3_9MICO|nr:zinc-binding alcohol dehydrogenase family protein [Microbacterium sp. KACC 23027]WEG10115.1 zinc-binding alcohol dehydrogenase family protein [Microbacterium sp. KACC 23027]